MTDTPDNLVSDLRGAARLAVDATVGVTDLVENLHRTIQKGAAPLAAPTLERTRGITGLVYGAVRGTTRLVGAGLDLGLGSIAGLAPDRPQLSVRDRLTAIINGLYGDHLEASGNPLALPLSLRSQGHVIDPSRPSAVLGERCTERVLVLAHGLCMNEGHWLRDGHDHGAVLAAELDATPIYLRYNTGLPIARNGRALAEMLEQLADAWPVPLREISVLGHSMGGLVARSACHHGVAARHNWTGLLRNLVSLGTPHAGTPLEQGGHWLDRLLEITPYSAPFARPGKARSAGITDLRQGRITEAPDEAPLLPAHTRCYALASLLGEQRSALKDALLGDGLVPRSSALGEGVLDLPPDQQTVLRGVGHLELLSHPGVYQQLSQWMNESAQGPALSV